jgi:hypothetical protein
MIRNDEMQTFCSVATIYGTPLDAGRLLRWQWLRHDPGDYCLTPPPNRQGMAEVSEGL